MLIALDWDETFTRDPAFWLEVLRLARTHHHRVIICTNRGTDMPIEGAPPKVPVIYADGQSKRAACRAQGYNPHIWVDDLPVLVDSGAQGIDPSMWVR